MKTRFTTLDLVASLHDIKKYCGLRVQNVYDVDSKTYLIKLQGPNQKAMIMFESGMRLHPTEYDWPKSVFPSSFSMKLRKHIKQKRLESVGQVGVDRIVDLQFGSLEWACHVIVELYDKGNVILTDHTYTVLNILRPRTDKDTDVKFAVRELYPIDNARQNVPKMSLENVKNIIDSSKPGDNLRRAFVPKTLYGSALLEHAFRVTGVPVNGQIGKQITMADAEKVYAALELAEGILNEVMSKPCRGYLVVKVEEKPKLDQAVESDLIETYDDFNPYLFEQMKHENNNEKFSVKELESFGQAVDEFFSKKESQKIDMKAMQKQKEAIKKLDNVKKDHERRLANLKDSQETDARRAELIYLNEALVDRAMLVIRSALANQMTWPAIHQLVDEGTANGDPTAMAIKTLKLDSNTIQMRLTDPFYEEDYDSDDDTNEDDNSLLVDIDLALNPHQNARKYFVHKKQAFAKEQKTIAASKKAVKSAEQKTQKTLKDVQVRSTVSKHRKPFWFEKFFWFISSDNYLVIGGRDAQQNELVVKKHLQAGDAYVHADLRGATSVVVKNKPCNNADPNLIPPKTFSEAGAMAVAYSAAWDAKVVSQAWWVSNTQVSKTAPTGEYLTSGSFMIRGKKNYMAAPQLQMGFGFMFRMDDECIAAHVNERNKQTSSVDDNVVDTVEVEKETEEIQLEGDSSEGENEKSEGEADPEFPDVQLDVKTNDVNEDYTILQIGPSKPVPKPKYVQLAEQKQLELDAQKAAVEESKNGPPKRGKNKKLKKMKEKYADQDEEERELRMKILGTLNQAKKQEQKGKKGKTRSKSMVANQTAKVTTAPAPATAKTDTPLTHAAPDPQPAEQGHLESEDMVVSLAVKIKDTVAASNDPPEKEDKLEEDDNEDEEMNEGRDDAIQVLDSLTANPFADDLLLFAVPVCAPYPAMLNYKYKVKLTPGTGKKGKATKTAIQIFIKDKGASQREKDLLSAAQEQQDLARNLPGKVKVSAPHILNVKKK